MKTEAQIENEKNLKKFQPGESGNPIGRPKGSKSKKRIFQEMANLVVTNDVRSIPEVKALMESCSGMFPESEEITFERLIAVRLIYLAITSNNPIQYIKEFYDRIEGRPLQRTEHSGEDGNPIILHIYDDGGDDDKSDPIE